MRATEEGFFAEQIGSAILDGMLGALSERMIMGCVPPQCKADDIIVELSGCTVLDIWTSQWRSFFFD